MAAFVLFKYGSAIEDHRATARRSKSSRKDSGRDKRDFMLQFPLIVATPIVVSFYVDFWMGLKAVGFVLALAIVYVLVPPGEFFPKGWKRKLRRSMRKSLRSE